jgi:hypothetical protein
VENADVSGVYATTWTRTSSPLPECRSGSTGPRKHRKARRGVLARSKSECAYELDVVMPMSWLGCQHERRRVVGRAWSGWGWQSLRAESGWGCLRKCASGGESQATQ